MERDSCHFWAEALGSKDVEACVGMEVPQDRLGATPWGAAALKSYPNP